RPLSLGLRLPPCAGVPFCALSYWYGSHPDLHSFPTRRSSDLGCPEGAGAILRHKGWRVETVTRRGRDGESDRPHRARCQGRTGKDRKSTRLNSSHVKISYAVFCLKKKKKTKTRDVPTGRRLEA